MSIDEKINVIYQNQDVINKKLDAIMERMILRRTKTIKDIAIELGKSVLWVKDHPWYLPNYGKLREGESKRKMAWTIEELTEWNKIPIEKRYKEYQARELKSIEKMRRK